MKKKKKNEKKEGNHKGQQKEKRSKRKRKRRGKKGKQKESTQLKMWVRESGGGNDSFFKILCDSGARVRKVQLSSSG